MPKLFTIADTRKMSKTMIETKLGEYANELEKLGVDHVSACEFLSSVMNLGIAAYEQGHDVNQK